MSPRVVLAAPALAVIPFNELAGLGLALGVLPAAVYPLPVVRRARRVIPLLGVLCGTALVLGSLLTQLPALAVPALFCLALGASLTARVSRLGALLLLLALPLTAIGLSLDDLSRLSSPAGSCSPARCTRGSSRWRGRSAPPRWRGRSRSARRSEHPSSTAFYLVWPARVPQRSAISSASSMSAGPPERHCSSCDRTGTS